MMNSKDNMNIRIARKDDIDTLFDIRTSVVENHQSREEIAELGITPESIVQMLETDCCAWIAEIDDRSIGFSIANATEKTIFGIFVLPSFECQGVGRALMQAAESWLWSKGMEEIWLVTGNNPSLRAYGFYLHLNWIPVGVETDGDFKGEMKFIKKRYQKHSPLLSEVKTKSLHDKLPLDEFEHPKLTAEQISYFITRLKSYEYRENDVEDKIAEYEKHFGTCVVTISIYETQIAFSIPYWKDSDEAIFEALMTASEINDTQKFAVYNPQNGTWNEDQGIVDSIFRRNRY